MDTDIRLKAWRGEAEWTIEAACEEIEGYLKSGRYVGIGEFACDYYWFTGRKGPAKNEYGIWTTPKDEPPYTFEKRLDELRQIVALAAKYDVPYYFHEFFSPYSFNPWKLLQRLCMEYPTAKIIVAHGGYEVFAGAQLGEHWVREACYCASFLGQGNVYLECAQWPAEFWEIAIKDDNIGPKQLVWGGEWGCMPTEFTRTEKSALWLNNRPVDYSSPDYMGTAITELRKVKQMGILTQDEINMVMGGNAAKLFKIPTPLPPENMYPRER
jgi:predicted TIM-barrel fold metal-dependent hydrolase